MRWRPTGIVLVAALLGCGGAQRLEYAVQNSRAMNGVTMDYAVYTPPGFRPGEEALPLVVLLHGGGDDERIADRSGLARALDEAIGRGDAPRIVMLVPDGDLGFWADWYDGSRRYESWILRELVPAVQERYGTIPCPEGCHLIGASMGGSAAVAWAMRHPDRFASVTALSALLLDADELVSFADNWWVGIFVPMRRVFGPVDERSAARVREHDPFQRFRSEEDLHGVRLSLAWGSQERGPIRRGNERFDRHLTEHAIPHGRRVYEGGHGWRHWIPIILEALTAASSPARDGAREAPR